MYIKKEVREKIDEVNTYVENFVDSKEFISWINAKKKYVGIKERKNCTCTKCKTQFVTERKINEYDNCPHCNQKLLLKRTKNYDDKDYYMYLIKYEDKFILRNYEVRSCLSYSKCSMSHIITEYGRQVLNKDGGVDLGIIISSMRRNTGGYFYINHFEKITHWKPERYISTYESCYVDLETIDSKYYDPREVLMNCDEIDVCNFLYGVYSNNYTLEILAKAKLYNLATHYYDFGTGNFEQVFKLDKSYLSFMQENNINYYELEVLRKTKIKDIELIRYLSTIHWLDELLEYCKPYDLKKYKIDSKDVYLYLDYLKFAKELGYNMSDKKILYPKDLKQKHDQYMNMINQKRDERIKKGIKRRYEKLKNNSYQTNKYIIYPAKNIEELIDESKQQNNCVKTYSERYAEGTCDIYFMRLISNKNKSLVTVEVRDKKVVQQRIKNNQDTTKEQKRFLMNWENKILKG